MSALDSGSGYYADQVEETALLAVYRVGFKAGRLSNG
jgi:hypothetical protein